MRVLIWATHLQTDILALASYLDRRGDIALMIVTPGVDRFLRTAFARVRPFRAPLLDRRDPELAKRIASFAPDVAVADNHIPPPGTAPRLFYMWHGLGWKARSRLDLKVFYHQVRQLIGADPREPGAPFLAQCYGPTDLAWRRGSWGLPAGSCVPIGMPFSDLLRAPPYSRTQLVGDYKIDVANHRTVLLSITWHYGGIFSATPSLKRSLASLWRGAPVNGRDAALLHRIVDAVRRHDANLLVCLHDRHRYDPAFLAMLESLASVHDFVELRFKNERPDNLSDLLVADVMLSNLSSFISYFYLLGRPAIHILPAGPAAQRIERTAMLFSRIRLRRRLGMDEAWMLDPHDTGGPVVSNADEAVAALENALADGGIGRGARTSWLTRHLPRVDGMACARFESQLRRLCRMPTVAPQPTGIGHHAVAAS